MKKIFQLCLFSIMFLVLSCETEELKEAEVNQDDLMALVTDEVLADIDFVELLDLGDDGIFWGDPSFAWLKSAEGLTGSCPEKEVKDKTNKRIVTLTFGEDCVKKGQIIIEYLKPADRANVRIKRITYEEFINNYGVIFNGTKQIIREKDKCIIKGNIEVGKINEEGEQVLITRKYNRQVMWICGTGFKTDRTNLIKKVSGQAEITKKVGEADEISYTRKILRPLLIVKACDLKIQAGVVGITKANGSEVKINYGKMPTDIDCDSEFECRTHLEVTKDGETFKMKLEGGKRIKVEKKDK